MNAKILQNILFLGIIIAIFLIFFGNPFTLFHEGVNFHNSYTNCTPSTGDAQACDYTYVYSNVSKHSLNYTYFLLKFPSVNYFTINEFCIDFSSNVSLSDRVPSESWCDYSRLQATINFVGGGYLKYSLNYTVSNDSFVYCFPISNFSQVGTNISSLIDIVSLRFCTNGTQGSYLLNLNDYYFTSFLTCSDGLKNGDETDIDCGGAVCAACSASVNPNENETGSVYINIPQKISNIGDSQDVLFLFKVKYAEFLNWFRGVFSNA